MIQRIRYFFDSLKHDPNLIIFSFICYMGSSFGQTFFLGLFSGEIREAFALSHGSFGTLYSVATLLSAVLLLWSARFIDKLSLKLWIIITFGLLAIACIILANAYHIAILFLALFLLRQAGQGLIGDIAFVALSRYLTKGKGKAVAIANLGLPMAESTLPVISIILISIIGWRYSWIIFAIFIIIIWLPLCLFLLRKHHIRHNRYLKQLSDHQQAETEQNSKKTPQHQRQRQRHYTVAQMLKDYRFYLLLPITTTSSIFITGLFFHQVHISSERPWTMIEWASLFPLYAIINIASAFVFGHLIDKKGAINILYFMPVFIAVTCIMLALPGSFATAMLAFSFLGAAAGCNVTIHGLIWAELYGTKNLGAIRSVVLFTIVFASACSPILFGVLFDEGVTVTELMLGFSIYLMITFIIALMLPKLYRQKTLSAMLEKS